MKLRSPKTLQSWWGSGELRACCVPTSVTHNSRDFRGDGEGNPGGHHANEPILVAPHRVGG